MTDKEIRIISRKKKELLKKVDPIALIRFMATRNIKEEDLEDKESISAQVDSIEAIQQMNLLDGLMKDMGYIWDSSDSLYVEGTEKKDSYADAWDAVTGRKKDSEDDETDEDDSEDDSEDDEDCDECDIKDICPIREKEEEQRYVPFDLTKEEDRARLRGAWVRDKGSGREYAVTGIFLDETPPYVEFNDNGFEPDYLLENYEFVDGSPCGRFAEEE